MLILKKSLNLLFQVERDEWNFKRRNITMFDCVYPRLHRDLQRDGAAPRAEGVRHHLRHEGLQVARRAQDY